jgi:transcriptional/translational regulatory protein YebC/TACO1
VTLAPELEVVEKVFKLVDALEDSDDVQNVYTNMEPSPEVLEALDNDDA